MTDSNRRGPYASATVPRCPVCGKPRRGQRQGICPRHRGAVHATGKHGPTDNCPTVMYPTKLHG